MRTSSVAVVKRISTRDCRESMQGSKIRAIDVDLEHRALSRAAALRRRSIQGVVRQNQTGKRKSSVAVGTNTVRINANRRETMQVRKPGAIGVDCEHRAVGRTAALMSGPIQRVARSNQAGRRTGSVAASKTMQGREV